MLLKIEIFIQGMSDGDAFDVRKRRNLREGVEKDLADINKEAEHEVLQAKLDKIDALIDHRRSKLSKLDEDEDMKALTDKKKVKELEKDIKKLEVARKKIEKMMSKFKGKKAESKEVIDEDETPLEASEEYMQYKEDAERRYDEDESIDSILSNYNNISQDMKDMLRDDLEGKMDGMDF
jgi:chromosome segregation ATPase